MEVDTSPPNLINMEYEYTSDDFIFNCEHYKVNYSLPCASRKRAGPNLYEHMKKLRIVE